MFFAILVMNVWHPGKILMNRAKMDGAYPLLERY